MLTACVAVCRQLAGPKAGWTLPAGPHGYKLRLAQPSVPTSSLRNDKKRLQSPIPSGCVPVAGDAAAASTGGVPEGEWRRRGGRFMTLPVQADEQRFVVEIRSVRGVILNLLGV